ncbi:MAG: YqgE/AlgH family protein [Actinomycetota bacterium]|nr:YqgE/AlgH family protein [Actinomycetota bacterium]
MALDRDATQSTAGRLLVSTPSVGDDNFDFTVVLMLEHGPEGALGLVLNRPSDTEVSIPLPDWATLAGDPPVLFSGGPVEPDVVLAIGRFRPGLDERADVLIERVGVVELGAEPDQIAERIESARFFAGYSGWGPGQLEGELAVQAWFVVGAHPDDALTDDPDDLWHRVLARQEGKLAAIYGNYPDDPSMN